MSNRDDTCQLEVPEKHAVMRNGFTTTHWSAVLLAGNEAHPEAAAALEYVCRSYWYPLYAYARRHSYSPEDAQDLTQGFFAIFLEKKYVCLANPDRGRFRSFLLTSFKHFLANQHHRSHAAKRGGHFTFVSWDEVDAEAHYQNEMTCAASPEESFDHTWALTLLEKVMTDLREEYVSTGKRRIFDALEVFLSGETPAPTYSTIGGRLQIGPSAVKMAVSRLRRRFGELLRREIAQTIAGTANVEDELRHLRCALSA